MSNKKTIIGSAAAIVASVALIGGGTFAAWSDFDVVTDQQVGAGALVFDIHEDSTPWSNHNLAPGQRVEEVWSVDTSESTVPGILSVAFNGNALTEVEDGCTSASSEAEVDPNCGSKVGGQFADFAVMDLAIVEDPEEGCAVAAFGADSSYRDQDAARTVAIPGSNEWTWYPNTDAPDVGATNGEYAPWAWSDSAQDLLAEGGVVPTLRSLWDDRGDEGVFATDSATIAEDTDEVCIYAAMAMPILDPEASSPLSRAQNAAQGDSVSFGLKFIIEQDVDGTPATPADDEVVKG